MANVTEIESLLVRLEGDATEYQKMLRDAEVQAKVTTKEIEEQAKKVEGFGAKLESFAGRAAAALTAIGGTALLKESFQNFAEAEGIALRLTAVLEANGRQVDAITEQYTAFAVAMEKTTVMEDDATLKTLALAESYDLTGLAAVNATQEAVAFATLMEGNAETYLRITAAMAEGNTELAMTMGRLVPQLRGIKDESLFIAKYQKLVAAGMKLAEAETRTAAGQIKILSRDFGNALEDVGKFVAQGVQPLTSSLQVAVGWFRELPDSVKATTTGVVGLSAAALSLQTVFPAAGPFGWAAAGAAGVVTLTGAVVRSSQAWQDYQKGLAQVAEQARFARERITEAAQAGLARFEKAPPEEKRLALVQELMRAEERIASAQRGVQAAQVMVEQRRGEFGLLPEAVDPESQVLTAALKEQQANLIAARVAWNQLDQAARQFGATGGVTKQVAADAEKLTAKLQEQIQVYGLASAQAEVYKLELRSGGAAALENARGLAHMHEWLEKDKKAKEEAAQAARQLGNSAAEMALTLEAEIAAFGMTSEAARVFKMELEGLDAQTANYLHALAEQKQALEAHKKLLEEGKKVTEDVATPEQKFAAEQARLNKLLEAGAIDQATYAKAVEKAEKELDKAGKTAQAAGQKFDAALAGSAEANQRIQQFRDSVMGDRLFKGEVRQSPVFDFEDQRTPQAVEPLAPTEFEIDIGGDEIVAALGRIEELLGRDDGETVVLRPAGVIA